MAPKSQSGEGPTSDPRTPFERFTDAARIVFNAPKPHPAKAKPKARKSRKRNA